MFFSFDKERTLNIWTDYKKLAPEEKVIFDKDNPYSGSFVPKEVLDSSADYDCLSLMVELNRSVFEYGPEDTWDTIRRKVLDDIMFYVMQNCE